MSTGPLADRVALVTGASRGIGRGAAVGLGEAGATVVVSGRTMGDGDRGLAGGLAETVELVTRAGGVGVAIRCDHRDDAQVVELFAAIEQQVGRLDILVNNATAVPADLQVLFDETPFWEVPVELWDDLFDVGLRSHFVASRLAVPMLIRNPAGLIINVSSAAAQSKFGILPYGVAKAGVDRMTSDMAVELGGTAVTVVSLWPPPSTTEGMLSSAGEDDDPSLWSSPVFTGRVIAALAARPDLGEMSGKAFRVRDLAERMHIADTIAPLA